MAYTGGMDFEETRDPIPLEGFVQTTGPDEHGMTTELFYAFNTVVTLQAFGDTRQCRAAYAAARATCRSFERRLSRTLPHSDIARLNAAKGRPVPIATDTAALLHAAQGYCADSEGRFDITMGAVVRLWDFHEGTVPERERIHEALAHVDWRTLRVWDEPTPDMEDVASQTGTATGKQVFAQLEDPLAAVDVGGIAKGWIADAVADLLTEHGLKAFIVNLGGNVVAHGEKPGGVPWRIGLQDPRNKEGVVGAVAVCDASAVTSGVYERCFEHDGVFYHHILNPETGLPAETDAAGATVIARRSLDAEGYSTTLLALGIERGRAFAQSHPAILEAHFVDAEGKVHSA